MIESRGIESPPMEYSNAATKKGWLYKKSTKVMIKKWTRRYFTLGNCTLIYYEKEDDSKQRGFFDFNQLSINAITCTQRKFEITITFIGSSFTLWLRAENTEELSAWVLALNLNVAASLGMRKEITCIITKKKFWRYQHISNYFFRRHANTGDLLLFRSKGFVAKMQRGLTRGIFDHCALIMCFASGKVILLEATDKDGVACLEWEHFLKMNWHRLYSKIIYRSLEVIRTEEMIRELEQFVKRVEGKKFGIGPGKLIGKNSEIQPGTEVNFFCSELIASAYKAMGIIPNTVKSSSIWPNDFSNERKLPLVNSALGQEMLIDFDL